MTIDRLRELLRQDAPYVYQQVNLRKPIPQKPILLKPKQPEEDDFIKGLEEDQKKLEVTNRQAVKPTPTERGLQRPMTEQGTNNSFDGDLPF